MSICVCVCFWLSVYFGENLYMVVCTVLQPQLRPPEEESPAVQPPRLKMDSFLRARSSGQPLNGSGSLWGWLVTRLRLDWTTRWVHLFFSFICRYIKLLFYGFITVPLTSVPGWQDVRQYNFGWLPSILLWELMTKLWLPENIPVTLDRH